MPFGQLITVKKKLGRTLLERPFIFQELLEKCGYKLVPDHCEATHKFEKQFITNHGLMENKFPRFHIVKDNGEWYIHFDLRAEHFEKGDIIVHGAVLVKEIRRLYQLFHRYFPRKFEKFDKSWKFISLGSLS